VTKKDIFYNYIRFPYTRRGILRTRTTNRRRNLRTNQFCIWFALFTPIPESFRIRSTGYKWIQMSTGFSIWGWINTVYLTKTFNQSNGWLFSKHMKESDSRSISILNICNCQPTPTLERMLRTLFAVDLRAQKLVT
jgi:hypothetical protein